MARFTVLRPIYEKTGETAQHQLESGRVVTVHLERVQRFVPVGPADSVEDARARYSPVQYGYGLVLEHNPLPRLDLRGIAGARL
jgi:hypothetical protein